MSESTLEEKHSSNMIAIASIFSLFILVGAIVLFARSGSPSSNDAVVSPTAQVAKNELSNVGVPENNEIPTSSGPVIPDPSSEPGADIASNYVNYSEATLAGILEDQGKALLFFHANWCPTCRAAEKDIMQNGDKLPKDITVIKTDYDKENELKRKYNIASQHTFVLIDKNMNELTKWSGGDVDTIVENLKNPL